MLKTLKSKFFIATIIPTSVIGALIILYFQSVKDLTIFPNHNQFHYTFYTDNAIGGNSEIIDQVVTDSIIKVGFVLKNGINSPYIGLTIAPKAGSSIQMGRHNQLNIKVRCANFDNMGIALYTANPFHEKALQNPVIPFYTSVNISEAIQAYSINFNQFKVPDWWLEMNNVSDDASKKLDLKSITNINISNSYTPNIGQKQSIEIHSVTFSRNNKPLLILILVLEIAVILLAFGIIYSVEKIQANKKSVTISYKPVESENAKVSKSDFIVFINNNFQNNQLTLDFISAETGVSHRRITNDIQNQFGCNFKSYINRLRINESKRLLLEKNLNIGEIAFMVGFNNQTHFNRVFKSELQISPTEYRDKHKI
jgi:AraC-like DNA-binding protein